MNLTKLLKFFYILVFSLFLLFFTFSVGCTGIIPGTTPAKTTPTIVTITHIPVTTITRMGIALSPTITVDTCPLPTLKFNNSLKITQFGQGNSLRISGPKSSPGTDPEIVPYRGIIYHDAGLTRIFDATGKQVLFVNDTESIEFTPDGKFHPVTMVYSLPDYTQFYDAGDNISNAYQIGNSTCLATIITAPSSRVTVISG